MVLLEELNTAQKEAVVTTRGAVLVLAGAGAGKTRVITHRIAHLVDQGVPAERILAMTFTNKAAKEMRERVRTLVPTVGPAPLTTTFHAFSAELLRNHAGAAGLPRHFSIFDRDDSLRAIKHALRDIGEDKRFEPRTILSSISRAKNEGKGYEEYEEDAGNDWYARIVADVWARYRAKLVREKALDFDDLLLEGYRLLARNQALSSHYGERFEYIHVDEYQDTNKIQYELVRILSGTHGNLFCVGDLDQNIYSWRGSSIDNILMFERSFPNATVLTLEENYRSTKTIVGLSNDIIRKNKRRKEKTLYTNNAEGEKVSLTVGYTEHDEALKIATEIHDLIMHGTPPRSIAILYRANFLSRVLEEALMRLDIPYKVLGTRFFDRKEVKDVLSYLRAALNRDSFADIARVAGTPPRGIGKTTLDALAREGLQTLNGSMRAKIDTFFVILDSIARATREKPPREAVAHTIKVSGLEQLLQNGGEEARERLENVRELVNLAVKYEHLSPPEGIEKLLEDAALATDQDELDAPSKTGDAVSVMTIHAAKGLEFDHVFVVGLEQGLFPHAKSDERADDEEERRLFYVALTRARHKLHLSYAESRMLYGTRSATIPSEFLLDIDPSYLETSASQPQPNESVLYLD